MMRLRPKGVPTLKGVGISCFMLAVALAAGCGGELASPPTDGQAGLASAKITIKWPEAEALTIPAETQSIRVQVSVGGVERRNIIVPRQVGLVTVVTLSDLPPGSAVFTGNAYASSDGTGSVLAAGQAQVTLVAGQTAFVSLVLTVVPPVEDTTPPNVSITSPANGATVSGTILIQAVATDNVGVVGVRFLADAVYLGEDTTSPYGASLDTTCFPNCSLLITATARDAAGNVGSDTVTVIVNNITPPPPDTTPPTVYITSPANGATVSGLVTIEANATDNVGVVGVRFVAGVDLGEDLTSPYQASWSTTLVANGTQTIQATARDAAGNTASHIITVTVENINLGPFEPFRGQLVSFAVTPDPSGELDLPEDFGQIVFDCKISNLVDGKIPWLCNLEDQEDGIVVGEIRSGWLYDPQTGESDFDSEVHPGDFANTYRRFNTATGVVSEEWAITGGHIVFVEFDSSANPGLLIFWQPTFILDGGATSLSDEDIRAGTWTVLSVRQRLSFPSYLGTLRGF